LIPSRPCAMNKAQRPAKPIIRGINMKKSMWIVVLIASLLLVACGGSEANVESGSAQTTADRVDSVVDEAGSAAGEAAVQAPLAEPEVNVLETAPPQTADAAEALAVAEETSGAISTLT